jgi:hypothetical protein
VPDYIPNERLNELLILLGRSLLQYVGESWPWTAEHETQPREVINRLVAEQQESVAQIAEFLDERGHRITYGSFPTEYTSLHYAALDYLLTRLIADQREIFEEVGEARLEAEGDYDAELLLTGVSEQARRHLTELEQLARDREARKPAVV